MTVKVVRFGNEELHAGTTLHQCPLVFSGTQEEVVAYAAEQGWEWVKDTGNVYGGYYRTADGTCYLPI